MKFPAHMTVELSPQDEADLASARRAFIDSMQGLTEAQQLARARAIAGGIRQTNPYTRALAQQIVDADKARGDILGAEAELENIKGELRKGGHRPVDPHWRGTALGRKEELEQQIEIAHARTIGIANDPLETAQKKAVLHFREARAEAKRTQALKEAVVRIEAKLDAEDLDRQAEGIARGRLASGRNSGRTASENQ